MKPKPHSCNRRPDGRRPPPRFGRSFPSQPERCRREAPFSLTHGLVPAQAAALLLAAAVLSAGGTSWGQRSSNWRGYRVADGLPESACLSVALGPHGTVLVRHRNRPWVSVLDGYGIRSIPAAEPGHSRVYESPAGQLWTVAPEGLQEFKEGVWVLHPVPEIAALFRNTLPNLLHPIPLCPVRQDLVFLLLPDRLLECNFEGTNRPQTRVLRRASQTAIGNFAGLAVARDGGRWIAGARGLAKVPAPARTLEPGSEWKEFVAPEPLQIQALQEPQVDEMGGVTTVAESLRSGQKVAVYFDGQRWTTQSVGAEKVRFAWRGPDQSVWAATTDSLWELQSAGGRAEWVENEEIEARQYSDLAVEPGGTFWLATSDGLFHYAPPTWRSPAAARKLTALVPCLAADAGGRLWFVAGGALQTLAEDGDQEFPLPGAPGRGAQAAWSLLPLRDGTLLLDEGGRLFQFHPGRGVFDPLFSGAADRRLHALGLLKNGNVCLESSSAAAGAESRLEVYDGTGFQGFPYPQPEPGAAGNFTAVFTTQNGDLWLGGEETIAWYHDQKWQVFPSPDRTSPVGVGGFAELADGKIWAATRDSLWEFDGRNWSAVRSGFDRINALLRSRDGSVWVASNGGLHRFYRGAWVENGTDEGLPSAAVRALCEDPGGRLWAATAHGLSRFHPGADTDPPQTRLPKMTERETNVPEGGTLTLIFSGQDKWKFTPRERLLFSYRLDERDWSPFREAAPVSFSDLPTGKHYFQVRAMDRNGNVDPNPARLEFVFTVPWYRERRLILIGSAGLAVALFFAGLAFNRHRRLVRSYAEVERKVTERTGELELAHRQLLHSQKMNALGTLAAGIAHDFNNILSIVKGSAQIIEDNLENPGKVRTRVDRIKTVVNQGAGVVQALLGFSRGSDGPPSPCDVNAVVDDTIKLLGDQFLREVRVVFERTPNLPAVPAAKDFIQQILLNLIFNAAESQAQRNQVVLATRGLRQLPSSLVLAPAPAAEYVSLAVRDYGCGIAPDILSRIFEPFFTTKALSVRRGTGLGLSMVYELARRMEAGLTVESAVGQGSTFTLILPVRELPVAAASRPETPRRSPHP